MTERERRLAENEAFFRELNENIERSSRRFGEDDHRYEFLCECSNRDCTLRLELTRAEYESVRAHPARFLVAPGHDLPEVEEVVEAHGGYMVIEKGGAAADIAAEHDRRRGDDDA